MPTEPPTSEELLRQVQELDLQILDLSGEAPWEQLGKTADQAKAVEDYLGSVIDDIGSAKDDIGEKAEVFASVGEKFEEFRSLKERADAPCPKCGKKAKKLISSFFTASSTPSPGRGCPPTSGGG